MSGDVQPRKRKDKRRKRDDRKSEGEVSFSRQQSFQDDDESSHGVHITKMGNEDVHLHVHHDHGTGGHWCAKLIFFSLMAVLLGLVGLIIMENRGLSDLDTPVSESRFSNYFDGWVEEHADDHEHDAVQASIEEHDEHDEPFEEEEYEPQSEAEDEEEEEDEAEAEADGDADEDDEEEDIAGENITVEETAENDDDEDEDEELDENVTAAATAEDQDEDEDEEYEAENDNAKATAEDEDEDEDEQDDGDNEEEATAEEEEDNNDKDDDDATADDEDADEDEDIEESVEQPKKQSTAQSAPSAYDDGFEEDDEEDADDDDIEESIEPAKPQSKPQAQSAPSAFDDGFDEDDDEDTFESLDQVVDNDAEELLLLQEKARQAAAAAAKASAPAGQDKADNDNENENDKDEEPSSWVASLAVKIGVGVALALVSRLVLIRNNPNTTDEPIQEACLRRRLTIATAEDHLPEDDEELPLLDDEYSEEEIEIEEEIEVEISDIEEMADGESEDNMATSSYKPETFEQLNAMYKFKQEQPTEIATKATTTTAQPATSKESSKAKEMPIEEPTAASDIYVEYEDGAIEDYAHEEEDEITDEEDENDDDNVGYEIDDEGDISDVDDTELMNRLEAKYGRLPAKEYESDEDSDDPTWTQIKPKEARTGAGPKALVQDDVDDDLFEQELRKANAEMIRENPAKALRAFDTLTQKFAHQPAAQLGRAHALEQLAEQQRSNQRLLEAIEAYKRYLAFGELITEDSDYRAAGERCIEHLRFMGYQLQAVAIHELLIERFSAQAQLRNQLSLTYLMLNQLEQVKRVAAATLQRWPGDGMAQLHYGLALKQLDGDYAKALPYLLYGVESRAEGTQEGYFYLALGETLQRLGRQQQALEIYAIGAEQQFFPSAYQRSLYNVEKLRPQPFWLPSETGYAEQFAQLQRHWTEIRDEALALLAGGDHFEPEAELLRDKGNWQQFELYAQGREVRGNCQRAPITCGLLDKFEAASGCRRGQAKFSAMQAQTHVWPHCGPTNCRLRAHLTLVAPEPELTSLRVAEEQRTWRAGELIIFDDSFEHEVWHNGTQLRLVLIVDVWHPDLSDSQRRRLTAI